MLCVSLEFAPNELPMGQSSQDSRRCSVSSYFELIVRSKAGIELNVGLLTRGTRRDGLSYSAGCDVKV